MNSGGNERNVEILIIMYNRREEWSGKIKSHIIEMQGQGIAE